MSSHSLEVYYDGACPLCRREAEIIARRDTANQILLIDIADARFDAATVGRPLDELMARIHARDRDGEVYRGVEVFRQIYARLGFRRLVWLSRLPAIAQLLALGYALFARNRLRLTGRCHSKGCALPGAAGGEHRPSVPSDGS
ncbi:MAG: DUF393 domain-containing protein [Deltaproteobacteria bacterium]|nr:DUF393 domain-containing protein [Deltaproteobacteria bacterium]